MTMIVTIDRPAASECCVPDTAPRQGGGGSVGRGGNFKAKFTNSSSDNREEGGGKKVKRNPLTRTEKKHGVEIEVPGDEVSEIGLCLLVTQRQGIHREGGTLFGRRGRTMSCGQNI